MNPTYSAIYSSPIGDLGILCDANHLLAIDWMDDLTQEYTLQYVDFVDDVIELLDGYFNNDGQIEHLPRMFLKGTELRQRVWNELMKIPPGTVRTYGGLTTELQTSSRAIGQACRTNLIPIVIPCHRIIAKSSLGGFMGKAHRLDRKQWLLEHEGFQYQ